MLFLIVSAAIFDVGSCGQVLIGEQQLNLKQIFSFLQEMKKSNENILKIVWKTHNIPELFILVNFSNIFDGFYSQDLFIFRTKCTIKCSRINTSSYNVTEQSETKYCYCVQNETHPLRLTWAYFVLNAITAFCFALIGDAVKSCFHSRAFNLPSDLHRKKSSLFENKFILKTCTVISVGLATIKNSLAI